MKYSKYLVLCLAGSLSLCHPIASAQGKEYVLGQRDLINLIIFAGGEKQHEVDLTVSAHGLINVPFIGSIHAKGLTVSGLEDVIRKSLSEDYFVQPEIIIRIKEYHSLRYFISGAVKSPGLYEMEAEVTILELIAKAGGLLPDRGNAAFIVHDAEKPVQENSPDLPSSQAEGEKINLEKLLEMGDMSENIRLQTNDIVYIPFEKSQDVAVSNIYIEGQIKSPGIYNYQQGMTALNACIMAGGFNRYAAANRTRIVRKDSKDRQIIIKIDLDAVKKGKIKDIELHPGDLIHIPESWM